MIGSLAKKRKGKEEKGGEGGGGRDCFSLPPSVGDPMERGSNERKKGELLASTVHRVTEQGKKKRGKEKGGELNYCSVRALRGAKRGKKERKGGEKKKKGDVHSLRGRRKKKKRGGEERGGLLLFPLSHLGSVPKEPGRKRRIRERKLDDNDETTGKGGGGKKEKKRKEEAEKKGGPLDSIKVDTSHKKEGGKKKKGAMRSGYGT